jgi:hypothetical protein
MKPKKYLLIIIFLYAANIYSQETDYTIKMNKSDKCDIYLQNRDSYRNVYIFEINDSSALIKENNFNKEVAIANIRTVKFTYNNGWWKGALYGAGVDVIATLIGGIATSKDNGPPYVLGYGLIGLIPSALIGGVIGYIADTDNLYTFSENENVKSKIKKLRKIIKENS